MKGVQQTVTLDTFKPPHLFQPLGGVAVIADSTWAALQGRRKLKVDWNDGAHAAFESEAFKKQLLQTVSQPAKVARNLGNVDAEFAKGGKVLEATYYTPLAAHASMEPPAAVAEVRDGKATIWAPTQNPQAVQDAVSAALGIDKKDVICHVTLLGGGFGRKSKPDYAAEAAVLSRKLGKPVKVVWTREDDIRFDYYHTTAAVYHKATVDGRGRPTAWLHRSAFPPIASTFAPGAREPLSFELDLGLTDLPFDVPNIRAENGPADAHVRIGWFRAVSNNFHAFAAHSFADEMAKAAGTRLARVPARSAGPGQGPRSQGAGRRVLELRRAVRQVPDRHAAASARCSRSPASARDGESGSRATAGAWASPRIAASTRYVASVVEVEVDAKGVVKVPRIEQVVDAGVIVNPDRVRSQMEGAAVMAVGLARTGEITAAGGSHQAEQLPRLPGGSHERCAVPGQRSLRGERCSCRPASASRACRRCSRRSATRYMRRPGAVCESSRCRRQKLV